MDKKKLALNKIIDLISEYLYYDRKNDDELSTNDMEYLIKNNILTKEEIILEFQHQLINAFKENYNK